MRSFTWRGGLSYGRSSSVSTKHGRDARVTIALLGAGEWRSYVWPSFDNGAGGGIVSKAMATWLPYRG